MKPSLPRVSILLPTYNSNECHLRQAIGSILSQTYKNFELIVIDDGSVGNDAEVIKSYSDPRVNLIEVEHGGIAKALNAGISQASGEYLFRMDGDDIAHPKRLEKQVEYLDSHPGIDIVHSRMRCIGSRTNLVASYAKDNRDTKAKLFFSCIINNPSVAMRASSLLKYDLHYDDVVAEDYDLWARAIPYLEFYEMPDALIKYRNHANQITNNKPAALTADTRIHRMLLRSIGFDQISEESLRAFESLVSFQSMDIESLSLAEDVLLDCIHLNSSSKLIEIDALNNETFDRMSFVAFRSYFSRAITFGELKSLTIIREISPMNAFTRFARVVARKIRNRFL